MANEREAGDRRGVRRPPEKSFGDARLGSPAGTRRDGPDRPRQPRAAEAGPGAEGALPKGSASTTSGAGEERRGPIVERKGGGTYLPPPRAKAPLAPVADSADPHAPAAGTPLETAKVAAPPPPERSSPRAPQAVEPPPAPFLEPPVETESFAELFSRSDGGRGQRISAGQKVSGRVVQIGRETAFLDLGSAAGIKTEALIDSRELRDEHGALKIQVGDPITGYVKSLDDGIWLTTALPKGAQREALAEARQSGLPVEGTVVGINKGGLEVDLGSGIRGFVPASQATLRFTPDLSTLVGQRLQFAVTQVKDRDIVLSRRTLLEREAKEKAAELRDTLVEGMQLEGTVTSLREFGAFVDLGGLEGLIPISELSHRRVAHPEELLKVGQPVTVEVLRVEPGAKPGDRDRIALSLKRLEDDPWLVAGNAIVEGQRFKGKVVRVQPFGAFVELSPGVDALLHVSKLFSPKGGRVTHPDEVLKTGEELWVEVETIDRAARKIGLRPLTPEEAALPPPPRLGPVRVGDAVEATVDKIESFGLFVRWPGGRGLLPAAELGTPRGADLRRSHPVGTKIKAQVIEVDPSGRVRLSAVAAQQAIERAEVAEYLQGHQAKGFGTFADLLKKKIGR